MSFEELVKESKAFDLWAKASGYSIEKSRKVTPANGVDYKWGLTHVAWKGWIARALQK